VGYEQLRDSKPDVVLIAIPPQANTAIQAVESMHAEMPHVFIVAVGEPRPQLIVDVMRAGANEFLEWPLNPESLREAFNRYFRRNQAPASSRGRVVSFLNAKGGSGATFAAVNTSVALAKNAPVVLVELAPCGAASLQLNVSPKFTFADAIQQGDLDASSLEGFLTDCGRGVQLLAAPNELQPAPTSEQVAHLLDVLTSRFRYVLFDASSRLDQFTKIICDISDRLLIVAQVDVVGLWSAAQVRAFVAGKSEDNRLGLLLNRYQPLPGFDEEYIERVVGCKIAWTIGSHYVPISRAIAAGTPVACDSDSDFGGGFGHAAKFLTEQNTNGRLAVSTPHPHAKKKSLTTAQSSAPDVPLLRIANSTSAT
jgi:pilus assembly protein CpaE